MPIVILAVVAIISLTDREANDCELIITAFDGTVLERHATTCLVERKEELILLGLQQDGSDLSVSATG